MDAPNGQTPLGDFLQASRARVNPEDVGLPAHGPRSRVPGLRREELAMLAGVSASYYTRLEQGQSRNASPQVLDALANALSLDETERAHLRALAVVEREQPIRARRPPTEHADPALLQLLDALGDVPAIVMGRRSDVLAWNRSGHALLAGNLPFDAPGDPARRPNMVALVFLDADGRALYANWKEKAAAAVGNLRLVAGEHADDPVLASLIGSLTMASPEFATLWADHRVSACAAADYELRHPLVGTLTVMQQTLRSVEHPDQVLVTHTTPMDSPSAEALALLAQLVHEEHGTPPRRPVLRGDAIKPRSND